MRDTRELTVIKNASDKDLIKRYDESISENERLACKAIDDFSASAKELYKLTQERSKKKRAKNEGAMNELVQKCETTKSHIAWYLNMISTSAASAALVAQKTSLGNAKKIRLTYGKKRVSLIEKYEKVEAEYEKARALMLPVAKDKAV